ncbi:MAG: SurA N-terminal domain-containing protein [Patescibacteria group bacterium]|nr:SurA N-terminal domain-containing protein [Patescibacteria group bacterium]
MPKGKSNFQRKTLIYIALVLGLIGLAYYFKSQFVVAWVNGQPISRMAYTNELQKLAKTQALDNLLVKKMIISEAKKQNLSVDQAEVDQAMQTIADRTKAQGSNLDDLLKAQGISLQEVREEVRLQKLLEKMVGEVTVADDQITSYWESNQALYPEKTLDEVKDEITIQLKQQELVNKIQELIGRLQAEAKVVQWL